jgi:hypothetical protein
MAVLRRLLAASTVVAALVVPAAAATQADAAPATARGYVTDGNLRTNPNLGAGIIDTIYNQWVNINCWIDGGDNGFGSNRWFQANYYGHIGYLSSGVVSQQPSVGHC